MVQNQQSLSIVAGFSCLHIYAYEENVMDLFVFVARFFSVLFFFFSFLFVSLRFSFLLVSSLRFSSLSVQRNRRSPCDCCGTNSGLTEADFLAGELELLNQEVCARVPAILSPPRSKDARFKGHSPLFLRTPLLVFFQSRGAPRNETHSTVPP